MRIFQHSDKACSDPARMFFGGKGLLYVSKTETKLDVKLLLFSFADYMCEFYGEKHYTQHLRSFYKNLNVPVKGCLPVTQELEHGDFCTISSLYNEGNVHFSPDQSEIPDLASHKSRRKVTRNFDFEILFQRCRLFHDFADGSAYYYYNELFLLAANLCNIEKGKNEFLRILNSEQNKGWEAYHKRNWNTILNVIIKADYKPEFAWQLATYGQGDINFDGKVSVADAVLLQGYLLCRFSFNETEYYAADLLEDGSVNVFDMVVMKRILLKQ